MTITSLCPKHVISEFFIRGADCFSKIRNNSVSFAHQITSILSPVGMVISQITKCTANHQHWCICVLVRYNTLYCEYMYLVDMCENVCIIHVAC